MNIKEEIKNRLDIEEVINEIKCIVSPDLYPILDKSLSKLINAKCRKETGIPIEIHDCAIAIMEGLNQHKIDTNGLVEILQRFANKIIQSKNKEFEEKQRQYFIELGKGIEKGGISFAAGVDQGLIDISKLLQELNK